MERGSNGYYKWQFGHEGAKIAGPIWFLPCCEVLARGPAFKSQCTIWFTVAHQFGKSKNQCSFWKGVFKASYVVSPSQVVKLSGLWARRRTT